VLGLLSIRPMSGYELKRVIDHSVGHFWSADQSQIYRTLAELVDSGLASRRRQEQEGRPDQYVHSITEVGLAELDSWIVSPSPAQATRNAWLARIFFAGRLSGSQVRDLLRQRHDEVTGQLQELEATPVPSQASDLGEALRLATLEYGVAQLRTELDWLAATEQLVDRFDA
jgi:DNA-binding PadR family transcriptional regulator